MKSFEIEKSFDVVFVSEAFDHMVLVLVNSCFDGVCPADIKSSCLACHDVNIERFHGFIIVE